MKCWLTLNPTKFQLIALQLNFITVFVLEIFSYHTLEFTNYLSTFFLSSNHMNFVKRQNYLCKCHVSITLSKNRKTEFRMLFINKSGLSFCDVAIADWLMEMKGFVRSFKNHRKREKFMHFKIFVHSYYSP